jgi:hypothetical protein
MKIDDIKVEPSLGPLVLATARDVDEMEARLWITFPAGYREYVTRLGDGELSGFVRIYPPWRIDKELPDWRLDINKYWFWQEEKDLLPRARAPECVYLGSTAQGDQLVFHPHRPERLFVLPRHEEKMFVAGADLLSAVDWMCSSGKLTRRIKDRTFEPWDSRTWPVKDDEHKGVVDPEGESLNEIVELGRQWARRHRARKTLFERACRSARGPPASSTRRSSSREATSWRMRSRVTWPCFASTCPTARFASRTARWTTIRAAAATAI